MSISQACASADALQSLRNTEVLADGISPADELRIVTGWCSQFFADGQVTELRALGVPLSKTYTATCNGYFEAGRVTDLCKQALGPLAKSKAIYFTLNPLNPDLLARRANRVDRTGKGDSATAADVLSRRWLLLDLDPNRPAGIGSTDEEKGHSLNLLLVVRECLRGCGWPDPIVADSGNGGHLYYRIDLPADDGGLVQRVLVALAERFDDPARVKIDRAVFDPARICKLPGTWARKGDNVPGRPHRRAQLIHVPDEVGIVERALLESVVREDKVTVPVARPASPTSATPRREGPGKLNVPRYLDSFGWEYTIKDKPDHLGRTVHVLAVCPFNADHHAPDACIMQEPGGKLSAKCFHNGCVGNGWAAFRDKIGKPLAHHYDNEPGSGTNALSVGPPTADEADLTPPGADCLHLNSDIGNGYRFLADHQDVVRYVEDWESWAVYDGVRWAKDGKGARVEKLGKHTIENMLSEAIKAKSKAEECKEAFEAVHGGPPVMSFDPAPAPARKPETNGAPPWEHDGAAEAEALAAAEETKRLNEERKRINNEVEAAEATIKWAKGCYNKNHKALMLANARVEKPIFVPRGLSPFDRRTELLNCLNVTVDLTTGVQLPHARGDYLTHVCPVEYDPNAKCPTFDKFLIDIFPNDPDKAGYVRRYLGYTLTGETTYQRSLLFHGEGANGKSVLLEVLSNVWGEDLAQSLPPETFLAAGDTHPEARAILRGKRLTYLVETEYESRLNEARLKAITGSDKMTARGMYGSYFGFMPTHKVILATNHLPRIVGRDDGIWRRLAPVEFPRRFWDDSDRDANPSRTYRAEDRANPHLLAELMSEKEGILAALVREAVEWYRSGKKMSLPPSIARALKDYRDQEDVHGGFFDRVRASERRMGAAEFFGKYLEWAERENVPLRDRLGSPRAFGREAKKRGFESQKSGNNFYLVEIDESLAHDADEQLDFLTLEKGGR